jgi:hypothetical protein
LASTIAEVVANPPISTGMSDATSSSDTAELAVGVVVSLWQRKTRLALNGVIAGYDEGSKKFQIDYHNNTTVHVSREWLEERIREARDNEAAGGGENASSGGGGGGVDAIREATFRRLQERHSQREKDKQARQEAEAARSDPKESPARFWEEFSARLATAEKLIKEFVASHTRKLKRAAAKNDISEISGASCVQASVPFVLPRPLHTMPRPCETTRTTTN